jgi:hypothetical protein
MLDSQAIIDISTIILIKPDYNTQKDALKTGLELIY